MTRETAVRLAVPIGDQDWSQGGTNALVTLLEYGDYECLHCGAAHVVVRELQRELGDKLRFAFRHFPLHLIHPHAQNAAEAAEAAGAQGKYWAMHGMLFQRQHRLDAASLVQSAGAAGCDEAAVRRDLGSHAHAAKVQEDFRGAVKSGVNSTPTFFIDEVRFDGRPDVASLRAALKEAMLAKRR